MRCDRRRRGRLLYISIVKEEPTRKVGLRPIAKGKGRAIVGREHSGKKRVQRPEVEEAHEVLKNPEAYDQGGTGCKR